MQQLCCYEMPPYPAFRIEAKNNAGSTAQGATTLALVRLYDLVRSHPCFRNDADAHGLFGLPGSWLAKPPFVHMAAKVGLGEPPEQTTSEVAILQHQGSQRRFIVGFANARFSDNHDAVLDAIRTGLLGFHDSTVPHGP